MATSFPLSGYETGLVIWAITIVLSALYMYQRKRKLAEGKAEIKLKWDFLLFTLASSLSITSLIFQVGGFDLKGDLGEFTVTVGLVVLGGIIGDDLRQRLRNYVRPKPNVKLQTQIDAVRKQILASNKFKRLQLLDDYAKLIEKLAKREAEQRQ
jgi:hypothetical protein